MSRRPSKRPAEGQPTISSFWSKRVCPAPTVSTSKSTSTSDESDVRCDENTVISSDSELSSELGELSDADLLEVSESDDENEVDDVAVSSESDPCASNDVDRADEVQARASESDCRLSYSELVATAMANGRLGDEEKLRLITERNLQRMPPCLPIPRLTSEGSQERRSGSYSEVFSTSTLGWGTAMGRSI